MLQEIAKPRFEELVAVEAPLRGKEGVLGKAALCRVARAIEPKLKPARAGQLWEETLSGLTEGEVMEWTEFEHWLKNSWAGFNSKLNRQCYKQ